jgi:hypothetical protein
MEASGSGERRMGSCCDTGIWSLRPQPRISKKKVVEIPVIFSNLF